jgi:hypothetical protein
VKAAAERMGRGGDEVTRGRAVHEQAGGRGAVDEGDWKMCMWNQKRLLFAEEKMGG